MTAVELREALHVRPYRDQDESSVLALLDVTLGGGPAGHRPADFFRWKHLENPAGRSFMLVAELDGEIVGFRAFMRWRFAAGDTSVRAVRAVDTATHPAQQGKGIFSTLTLQALEALRGETDLVFNTPNASSLPGYLKMGWSVVGRMPVWIRVRRPLAFVRGVRSIHSPSSPPDRRPQVQAPPAIDILDRRADLTALLEEAAPPDGRLATPLDADYLAWRYGRAPALGYRVIIEETAGVLSGAAFFRVRPRGDLWETTLGDVIVRSGDRRAARRLIGRVVSASRVHHVTCHFPTGSSELAGARTNGFIGWRRGEVFVVNALDPELAPTAGRLDSWSLSLGTLEVF